MVQVSPYFAEIHVFDPGGEGLCLLIGDLGVILAQIFQDKVGDVFDIMLPFFFGANVIDLSRLEILTYICKGAAGIFNIVKDALVSQVNGVRLISHGFLNEGRYDTPVRAVVLVGPVSINRSYSYRLRAEHGL